MAFFGKNNEVPKNEDSSGGEVEILEVKGQPKSTISAYKTALEGDLEIYKKTYEQLWTQLAQGSNFFSAPELIRAENPTIAQYERAITATEGRIAALEKMETGESITEDEHELLMKIAAFAQDPQISEYRKNYEQRNSF